MSTDRIHRLLRLITLLQSGRVRSAEELAATLGISRRTLFRDLNMLQLAGIPYYHQPKDGFKISRDFFLPPINLTVPETLGLLLLGKFAESRRKWPMIQPAIQAIHKLAAAVPEPMRSACGDLASHVTVNPGPQDLENPGSHHYATLQKCIDEQRTCRIRYQSPVEAQPLECKLEPYVLHFANRAWYVLGKTDIHDEVRVFKCARLIETKPLLTRFKRPSGFTAETKLGKAWQLIPEGQVHHVELIFSAKLAMNVTEVLWHPTQRHEILKDGRCRMFFEVDGLGEIAWWICGYADQVVVRKPAALRNRVQTMLKSALRLYGTPDKFGFFFKGREKEPTPKT